MLLTWLPVIDGLGLGLAGSSGQLRAATCQGACASSGADARGGPASALVPVTAAAHLRARGGGRLREAPRELALRPSLVLFHGGDQYGRGETRGSWASVGPARPCSGALHPHLTSCPSVCAPPPARPVVSLLGLCLRFAFSLFWRNCRWDLLKFTKSPDSVWHVRGQWLDGRGAGVPSLTVLAACTGMALQSVRKGHVCRRHSTAFSGLH